VSLRAELLSIDQNSLIDSFEQGIGQERLLQSQMREFCKGETFIN